MTPEEIRAMMLAQSQTHPAGYTGPPTGMGSLEGSPLGAALASGKMAPATSRLTGLGSDMRPLDPSQATTAPAPTGDPRPAVTAGDNFDPTTLTGGGPPRIGTLTNRSTVTKTTDAPHTVGEVKALGKSMDARALDKRRSADETAKASKLSQHKRQAMIVDAMLRRKEARTQVGAHKEALGDIRGEYNAARESFMKLKVDPDRFIENMPTFAKVMMVISAGLGGLAEGLSEGKVKSNAMKILGMAINRDIDAQKANIAKTLKSLNMTGAQEGKAFDRLKYWETKQRQAAFDYAQMSNGADAVKADSMAKVSQLREHAKLIKEQSIKLPTLARPKVVKTEEVKKRQAVMGGGGTAKGRKRSLAAMGLGGLTDKTTIRDLRTKIGKAADARSAAGRLKQLMSKVNWKTGVLLKGVNPNSWASMVKHAVHLLGFNQRAIFGDKGPIRHDDAKTFAVVPARSVLNYVMSNKWIRRSIGEFMRRADSYEANAIKAARMTIPQILHREGQLKKRIVYDDKKAGAGVGRERRWQN